MSAGDIAEGIFATVGGIAIGWVIGYLIVSLVILIRWK